jgi:AcrR family transcriptional regulator
MPECNTADPILEAARATVLDFGVRRTTLTEVARRAGLSRMTVYRRFSDAPELMRALMTAQFGDVLAQAQADAAGLADGRSRAVAAVIGTAERLMGHPLMLRLLELEPEALLPYLTERVGEFQQAGRAALSSVIEAGQADGSVRAGDASAMSATVETAARGLVVSVRGLSAAERRSGLRELELMLRGYLSQSAA